MTPWKTEYDKVRYLQQELDKAFEKIKLLKKELKECQNQTMMQ